MLPDSSRWNSRLFGVCPTGEPIYAWTIRGVGGIVLETISYGATVTRLLVPDRNGRLDDVVLGFNDLDSYLSRHPYFGSAIGRVAGRITQSTFTLDGTVYKLTPNESANHLHGGLYGFDRKIWKVESVQNDREDPSITFCCQSCHGEEGYPGNIVVKATYTITRDNSFIVHVVAESDSGTPFNFTQHSYFNLAGEHSGSLNEHLLQIEADEYVPTDDRFALAGILVPVDHRPNDFRSLRNLIEAIPYLFERHGDLYCLRSVRLGTNDANPQLAARLLHPPSGRLLEVSTTEPYLQLYTGSALDGSFRGKSGCSYGPHAGLCLECHGYPEGIGTPALGDIVLRPGQPKQATTVYRFSNLT